MSEPGQPLVERLLRENAAGERVFSDAEVRHALPYILLELAGPVDVGALAPETKRLMDDFAGALRIGPGLPADEVRARVRAFYEASPVRQELLDEVTSFAKERPPEVDGAAVANSFARFIGERPAVPAPVEEPGEGAVRSSPLARFQLGKKREG